MNSCMDKNGNVTTGSEYNYSGNGLKIKYWISQPRANNLQSTNYIKT